MTERQTVKLAYIRVLPEEEPEKCLPPVILHHGLIQSKERWKKLMQPLANKTRRTVYAVDARNHGESEQSNFFNLEILADDLENFLKSMSISQAVLVGHSIGGIAIMKLALAKPTLVEAIVVEDILPRVFDPELSNLLAAVVHEQNECITKDCSSADTSDSVQQKLRECVYRTVPILPDADHEVLQKTIFPIRETENGYAFQANMEVIRSALLNHQSLMLPFTGSFEKPTLFIYGENSLNNVKDNEDEIAKFFPKLMMYCIQGSGHEVYDSNPKEYETALVQFLQSLE